MAHFAKVENGVVIEVIVADQSFIDSGSVGDPKLWIQTSYNTRRNQHPEGKPLRGNYASIGYTYDKINDVFIRPKPTFDAVLDESIWDWIEPEIQNEDFIQIVQK